MSPKLSICISTFNRAAFIGATLETIITQATHDCEILVLDGASTDDTEQVVLEYTCRFDRLRYVKQDMNNGVDRDFDRAVELAYGEYCWLFSDDDLIKPNAIAAVLEALRSDYSLVLVNGEHRDFDMSNVRIPNFFGIESDRVYAAGEMDRLFADMGTCLICICCVVIKRELWLARERERYYGSRFIHVGVIFQAPLPGRALVMATPLMSLRLGNEQTHMKEFFLVWRINLPSLVWSLPIAESTKRRFSVAQPWRRLGYLLALRSMGSYSLIEYRRWISPRLHSCRERLFPVLVVLLPRRVAHSLYVLHAVIAGGPYSPHEVWSTMLPKSWTDFVSKQNK